VCVSFWRDVCWNATYETISHILQCSPLFILFRRFSEDIVRQFRIAVFRYFSFHFAGFRFISLVFVLFTALRVIRCSFRCLVVCRAHMLVHFFETQWNNLLRGELWFHCLVGCKFNYQFNCLTSWTELLEVVFFNGAWNNFLIGMSCRWWTSICTLST